MNREKRGMGKIRLLFYVSFLLVCWGVYAWLATDFSYFRRLEAWSMISGYLGFIFIGVTLLIGPIKQWLPGKAAVYLLSLRRDAGIFGGLAAIFHVITVLIIFEQGPEFFLIGSERLQDGWWGLFFTDSEMGGSNLNMSLTGVANYMGAVAFSFLLAMWATSSDRTVQLLGGAAWKRVHLSNLMIFVLVTFHGVIYVDAIKGAAQSYPSFLWMAAAVLLIRFAAFLTTVAKRKKAAKDHKDRSEFVA